MNMGLNVWTINHMATDFTGPAGNGYIYLATPGGVLRSQDSGKTWTLQAEGLRDKSAIKAVMVGPEENVVWAVGEHISRSTKLANTFVQKQQAKETDNYKFNTIVASESYIYVGSDTRIHWSSDNFTSPTSSYLVYPLPVKVSDLMVVEDKVVAACDQGIFVSSDQGNNWRPLAGLELRAPRSLGIAGDNVPVGTTGHGLYSIPVSFL